MTKYIKEFIEDNIELVETENWDKLAELCDQNYLKELAVYLNLADISANFEVIEYSPDTWVATYSTSNSSIASTIHVQQLKDYKCSDGEKFNAVLQYTYGPTTIIFKDGKYLDFRRYQLADTKSIKRLATAERNYLLRNAEISDLINIITEFLTNNNISYRKNYGNEFYGIQLDSDTTLSISAFYRKNKLTQEAKVELDVRRYNPSYISTFSTENYSEIKASGLKTFINDFIDMLNKKYNTDFQKF